MGSRMMLACQYRAEYLYAEDDGRLPFIFRIHGANLISDYLPFESLWIQAFLGLRSCYE